ncbi:hypothetical protein Fmac_029451 [Flemingia macrophylla]|uniref:Uncharacterized protein n=1 Tax=Flemingia macrophylla TaxID=520843 RepID=A0ABD1LAE2_9FABA
MRFDPRSYITSCVYLLLSDSIFPFILHLPSYIYLLTPLHALDGTDLGPGFIPHT